jgi:hypothetical protein
MFVDEHLISATLSLIIAYMFCLFLRSLSSQVLIPCFFWQATLGLDCKGKDRTVVKCKVGDNPELLLCSLIPGVSESCALDLLFDQEVTFTVSGATSVHLTGYYMPLEEPYSSEEDEDEYDSYPLKNLL